LRNSFSDVKVRFIAKTIEQIYNGILGKLLRAA